MEPTTARMQAFGRGYTAKKEGRGNVQARGSDVVRDAPKDTPTFSAVQRFA